MSLTIERYEESGLGLPYPVVLVNVAQEDRDSAGKRVGVSIPNMEELVAVVAISRALHPYKLHGSEVRFIRQALGMTAKEFAAALAMDAATLSRWENGKQDVGGWADKQVRFAAIVGLLERAPGLTCDQKDLFNLRIQHRPDGVWPEIVVVKGPKARRSAPKQAPIQAQQYDACRAEAA